MPITAEIRERRKRYLGSSDIAAIVGYNQYANAADIWLAKTGRLVDDRGSTASRAGQHLEKAALSYFEEEHGVQLARDIWLDDGEFFCANLDGAVLNHDAMEQALIANGNQPLPRWTGEYIISPVEAKSTALKQNWGQVHDEDAVPDSVLCQVQWQIGLIGPHCQVGWVPVLFPGYKQVADAKIYRVERNQEMIDSLQELGRRFWKKYVEQDQRPPDVTPHLDVVKRVRRELTTISLGDDAAVAWETYEAAKAVRTNAEANEEHAKAAVLTLLGDSQAGMLPDGRTIQFATENGAKRCDLERLLIEEPEMYKRLVTVSTRQVLRIKKARGSR